MTRFDVIQNVGSWRVVACGYGEPSSWTGPGQVDTTELRRTPTGFTFVLNASENADDIADPVNYHLEVNITVLCLRVSQRAGTTVTRQPEMVCT